MIELSIVIPVLNEAKNISILIPKINEVRNKLKIKKFEILLVDDDSNDDTKLVVRDLKKKYQYLSFFIRKNEKKDLSRSCILGFNKALYKNILVMDGDLQHHPKYISNMLKVFSGKNCDIVIGSRDFQKKVGLSFFRKTFSKILIVIINTFLGNKTKDPMSGFFIFKKKIFKENRKKMYAKGYKILADLIYTSKKKLIIKDVIINFDKRTEGKSKMNLKVLVILIQFILEKYLKNIGLHLRR
jgi:dolichol-phosphate mannosyltransferase